MEWFGDVGGDRGRSACRGGSQCSGKCSAKGHESRSEREWFVTRETVILDRQCFVFVSSSSAIGSSALDAMPLPRLSFSRNRVGGFSSGTFCRAALDIDLPSAARESAAGKTNLTPSVGALSSWRQALPSQAGRTGPIGYSTINQVCSALPRLHDEPLPCPAYPSSHSDAASTPLAVLAPSSLGYDR